MDMTMAQEQLILSHIKGLAARLEGIDSKLADTREGIASLKTDIEYIKSTLLKQDQGLTQLETRVRELETEVTRGKAWAAAIAALTGGGVSGLARLIFGP